MESKQILSVGIDIGTTTSHLVFSRLTLRTNPFARTRKLHVAEREILYKSRIHLTPLRAGNSEIDVDRLLPLLEEEYRLAGYTHGDVDTGAVIITGESSRKSNAQRIIEALASESGRFVAATAGPNYEAVISAHGSGAVQLSKRSGVRLIHTDIGGGTSNIALIEKGEVTSTSCLNVGGRLVAYDEDRRITRLESSGKLLLRYLNLNLNLGDRLREDDEGRLCRLLAEVLVSELTRSPHPLGDSLRTVAPLNPKGFHGKLSYSFSGGVAEYIYGYENSGYGDLGRSLGETFRSLISEKRLAILEVPERIRATVIGASSFTLQVSGPTTFTTPGFRLPLKNVQVVSPRIPVRGASARIISEAVTEALRRGDYPTNPRAVAVAFRGVIPMRIEALRACSAGLTTALASLLQLSIPVVLAFEDDAGNTIGSIMWRELKADGFLSIDEVELQEGDFLDIGEPLPGDDAAYPMVVKSIQFI